MQRIEIVIVVGMLEHAGETACCGYTYRKGVDNPGMADDVPFSHHPLTCRHQGACHVRAESYSGDWQ